MKKRYLAMIMALCLVLTSMPLGALATDETKQLPSTQIYSDVSDIFGPTDPDKGGENKPNVDVILPDPNDLQSNEDFMDYNPYYPKKSQYGDYILQVPELKGRLTFSAGKNNQVVGTLFAPGTSKKTGWKDATKTWWNNDSNLCFAASSSNLLSWYLEQYKKLFPEDITTYVTSEEAIFDRFRKGWPNEGGDQKEALSWYFTGGFPSGNDRPAHNIPLTGVEKGGYLKNRIPYNTSKKWSEVSYDWQPQEAFSVYGDFEENRFPFMEEVSGHIGNGDLSNLEKFSEQIIRQLHYGVCSISIIKDDTIGGAGHAITLWGVDYDVETGLVSAIYVTDSDDQNNLFRVEITRGPGELNGNYDGVRLVKYPYHAPGNNSPFTKIRDSVLLYAPNVVIRNQGYDGPDAVIDEVIPDDEGNGVKVVASNIPGRTLEYGYSYDKNADNVISWQTSSHFPGLKPDKYYFFARVKGTSGQGPGGLSAPVPYRVKTASPISKEKFPSISLGTKTFHPYNETPQYIWYGMDSEAEEPILWRVLDTKSNNKETGLFLLSEQLFGSETNGSLNFTDRPPYDNNYLSSSVKQWCQRFEKNYMTSHEQVAILKTTKSDKSYFSEHSGVSFKGSNNILSYDKIFLPSVEEILTVMNTTSTRKGWYHGSYQDYWLRSPAEQEEGYVGYVDKNGNVKSKSVIEKCVIRPAFNLDSSQVLYSAAVGNGQFTDKMGLEKIQTVQSCDFRVVLKDANRAFKITTSKLSAQAGESVSLSYKGAEVGQMGNEYISVILLDSNETPAYYGKVAPVSAVNGSVSFVLPSDLSNGNYTLKVFNEQYNGEKKSGKASGFFDIHLTIEDKVVAETVTEVNIAVPAPVTDQMPQAADITNGGIVVGTTWKPDHNVFQPDTHYDVTVTVKAELNHKFTSATVFRLNGHPVTPTVQGEEYTVTYRDFPKTTGDLSGDGSDTDNSGSTKPEITYGPDGSKIETVIKPDGAKVETTTWPNGDKSVTEIQKDGSVSTNTEKMDGTIAKTSIDKDGQTKAEVMVSKKAIEEAKESRKPLKLPISQLKPDTNTQSAPVVIVNTKSEEKINVTIPVYPLTYNTVAVIVHKDGTEEVIRKSANVKNGVTLSVENGSVIKILDNTKIFADTSGHWAKDSINFVTSHKLYSGTSKNNFSPNAYMTRGMLAVVLHNLESNPDSTYDTAFKDVKVGEWYTKAICWAVEEGIVLGYNKEKFGPNDQITREQLAVMLYRYAGTPAHNGLDLNFQDANEVSDYAQKAMWWAVENGIIIGTGDDTLNPKGIVTRAQAATMLMRFVENIW